MDVQSAEFELLADPPRPDWVMRITIRGALEQRALPLVAEVGDQPVLALMPTLAAGGVQGFLAREPDPGDRLRIGFLDEPLEDTDVTYTPPSG
jgi:hypothetical protein